MTVQVCENFCKRHIYVWLKKGFKLRFKENYNNLFAFLNILFNFYSIECSCSDTLEDLHRLDSNKCNIKCGGNRDQHCGSHSDNTFSIYKTSQG